MRITQMCETNKYIPDIIATDKKTGVKIKFKPLGRTSDSDDFVVSIHGLGFFFKDSITTISEEQAMKKIEQSIDVVIDRYIEMLQELRVNRVK